MMAFSKQQPQACKWTNEAFDRLIANQVSDPELIRLLNALSSYLGDGSEQLSCAQMVPIFGYLFQG
jgi:hypothetical protein